MPPTASGFLSSSLLRTGTPAPRLSLTADDGAWIRLSDRVGHRQAVVVFIRRIDDGTAAWLSELGSSHAELEQADTDVVVVHTARTDRLRAWKNQHRLTIPITYDPFAFESRGWRASSRLRPITKDTVYIVDMDGNIGWSQRGLPSVAELVQAAATSRGVSIVADRTEDPSEVTTVRHVDSGEAVAFLEEEAAGWMLLDVRTRSEFEADHAPMAVHIPVDELPQRVAELGQTHNILCICQAGGRSQAAAEFLVSVGGQNIFNVMGGMSAWSGPRVTGGISS